MKKSVLTILFAALALVASAQSRTALRINEVMVVNDSSMVDEYGNHVAWVELFNTNFAPLQISSMYLTTDPSQPRMYPVPLGDVKTKVEPRQHVVFFADGEPNKGTFHTSFVFIPGVDNWIGLYDTDGETLIDEVVVPASLLPDQSWARTDDGTGEWALRTGGDSDYVTPGSANVIKEENPKVAYFAKFDEHGFGMTLMAMGIVFSALLVLYLSFHAIGNVGGTISKLNKRRAHGVTKEEASADELTVDSGEAIAAVVMALNEHLDAHDAESAVLTINKVKRAYSPWSSKIYSLREVPEVLRNTK